MNFVFLMDPLSGVKMEKDTSFLLMLGALRQGHRIYYLPKGGMTLNNGRLRFHVQEVIPQEVKAEPFVIERELVLEENEIDAIFIRTDPPFDYDYLMHTWLLDRVQERIFIINHPQGIRTANEKIWAAQFTSLVPPTLIGRRREDLLWFLSEHKRIVAKPADGYGGQSVFILEAAGANIHVILETMTHNYRKDIILQKYVPEADQGDKRILLLNGEPLGAVLRVHAADDHRNNFFSGGKPFAAEVTPRDREIIRAIKPHLKKLGLYFVGIDILGDYLVEVNVTSPTCMQEMNRFTDKHLENKVIEFVEHSVMQRR